jgi:hypothetical protein
MPIKRVLRRIDDKLAQLEIVAVRCICWGVEACIEGFAAAGAALHGYPTDLDHGQETPSERKEGDSSKREQNESRQRKENGGKRSNHG